MQNNEFYKIGTVSIEGQKKIQLLMEAYNIHDEVFGDLIRHMIECERLDAAIAYREHMKYNK